MPQMITQVMKMPGPDWVKGATIQQYIESMQPLWAQQESQRREAFDEIYKTKELGVQTERLGIEDKRAGIEQQRADETAKRDANKLKMDEARQKEIDRHNAANEYLNNHKNLTTEQRDAIREKETNRHNTVIEGIDEGKLFQGEEKITIQQEVADVTKDKAATYKYQVMANTSLKKEEVEANIQLGKDKLAEMKKKVPAGNSAPFKLAEDKYNKLAALYQSQSNPMAMNKPAPKDLETLKGQMDAAYQEAEKLSGGGASSAIPQDHIDYLKANPDKRDSFDATYGAGEAAKILGN